MTDALTKHKPVLVQEVLTYLDPQPGGVYLDATFGYGGHTRAILEKESDCTVIALDWDKETVETRGHQMMEEFPHRLNVLWGNFALLYKILKKEGIEQLDGVLADVGTSQVQIGSKPGMSLYRDTFLDMRMSTSHHQLTAAEILNKGSEEKIRDILWEYGQERHAKRIARTIVEERVKHPITTTTQLASLVKRVVAPGKSSFKIHPATQTFQALRIFVNKELDNINAFLPAAFGALKSGGTLVCIAFHSLEDRLIKQFMKERVEKQEAELLTPRVVIAGEQEVRENFSSRSAKLRAIRAL